MPIIDPRDIDPHLRRKNAELQQQIEEVRQYLEETMPDFHWQPGTAELSTPEQKLRHENDALRERIAALQARESLKTDIVLDKATIYMSRMTTLNSSIL